VQIKNAHNTNKSQIFQTAGLKAELMVYICAMFTTGRIIFVAVFIVIFIAGLIWSYRKEKNINKLHFNKTYKILIALILFLILQFIIVKIRKFL
jgi:hypothetical protein